MAGRDSRVGQIPPWGDVPRDSGGKLTHVQLNTVQRSAVYYYADRREREGERIAWKKLLYKG